MLYVFLVLHIDYALWVSEFTPHTTFTSWRTRKSLCQYRFDICVWFQTWDVSGHPCHNNGSLQWIYKSPWNGIYDPPRTGQPGTWTIDTQNDPSICGLVGSGRSFWVLKPLVLGIPHLKKPPYYRYESPWPIKKTIFGGRFPKKGPKIEHLPEFLW